MRNTIYNALAHVLGSFVCRLYNSKINCFHAIQSSAGNVFRLKSVFPFFIMYVLQKTYYYVTYFGKRTKNKARKTLFSILFTERLDSYVQR